MKKIFLAGSDLGLLEILKKKLDNFATEIITDATKLYRTIIKKEKPYCLILESIFPQWDWNGYMIAKLIKYDIRFQNLKLILVVDPKEDDAEVLAHSAKVDLLFFKGEPLEKILDEVRKDAG